MHGTASVKPVTSLLAGFRQALLDVGLRSLDAAPGLAGLTQNSSGWVAGRFLSF
jgi:hypothetical protein